MMKVRVICIDFNRRYDKERVSDLFFDNLDDLKEYIIAWLMSLNSLKKRYNLNIRIELQVDMV